MDKNGVSIQRSKISGNIVSQSGFGTPQRGQPSLILHGSFHADLATARFFHLIFPVLLMTYFLCQSAEMQNIGKMEERGWGEGELPKLMRMTEKG